MQKALYAELDTMPPRLTIACPPSLQMESLREEIVSGNLALDVSRIGVSGKAIRGDEGYVDGAFGAGNRTKVVYLAPDACIDFFCNAVLLCGVFHLADIDDLIFPADEQVDLGPANSPL